MNNIDLLGIIKNEMTRSRKPASRRLPTFYPSEASVKLDDGEVVGGCWRKTWYRVNRIPASNATDFYLSMIYSFGNHIEDVVVEQMKRAGIYENCKVKFYDPKYNVSGELDIVGRYRRDNGSIGLYGVEVKSVYGMGATMTITGRARAWKGQPAFRAKPKDNNLMQTMIYLDQFTPERGAGYALEGFKLLYLPRDKPVDGRSYTVTLVSKDDLSGPLTSYGEEMNDGERYALVESDGLPDYVDTRFSIEDVYAWFAEQKEMFEANVAPDRPFKKYYNEVEVRELYELGKLSKSAFDNFTSGKKNPGHFLCQSYCDYRDFCYKRNGSPREEADNLVQIQGVLTL